MFLIAENSFEWGRFIQVLGWICVPFLMMATLLTVLLHYRRRKRSRNASPDTENDFVLAFPEQFAHKKEEGEYVYFDHTHLILEYKKRMFYNHARFVSLQKDYTSLETKYASLLSNSKHNFIKTKKTSYMKNLPEQTSPAEMTHIPGDVVKEKKELADKYEKLDKDYRRLQEENRFLHEQMSLQTAGDDEREKIVQRWKEEHQLLKDKITEQEYMQELLEERKAQIIFLQDQAEQRIKNNYQSEQQRIEAIQQVEALKNELLRNQESADKLQAVLCEKEELLVAKEQELTSKADRVTYLENVLKETKEQNELLKAEALDNKDIAMTLREELDKEQSRINFLEQKLESNKQLLKRVNKEIASLIDAGEEVSPVIELNPVYKVR